MTERYDARPGARDGRPACLAGLKPAGVICEMMNDDGTMARMPDLERFSAAHEVPILQISDLVAYRERAYHRSTRRSDSRCG